MRLTLAPIPRRHGGCGPMNRHQQDGSSSSELHGALERSLVAEAEARRDLPDRPRGSAPRLRCHSLRKFGARKWTKTAGSGLRETGRRAIDSFIDRLWQQPSLADPG